MRTENSTFSSRSLYLSDQLRAQVVYIDCIRDRFMEIQNDVAEEIDERAYNDLLENDSMHNGSSDD